MKQFLRMDSITTESSSVNNGAFPTLLEAPLPMVELADWKKKGQVNKQQPDARTS